MEKLVTIADEAESAVRELPPDCVAAMRILDRVSSLVSETLYELSELLLEGDISQQEASVLEGRLKDVRTDIRKAKVETAKRAVALEKSQREELLRGNTKTAEERRKLLTVEAAKQAGSDLTESLKMAKQMMNAEVEKSIAAIAELDSSTQELKRTRNQHSTYESVLQASSQILAEIHRGSIMDKLILWCGLTLFLSTVAYILWKRSWLSLVVSRVFNGKPTGAPPETPLPGNADQQHYHNRHDEL